MIQMLALDELIKTLMLFPRNRNVFIYQGLILKLIETHDPSLFIKAITVISGQDKQI
jgi:hypothetical protein